MFYGKFLLKYKLSVIKLPWEDFFENFKPVPESETLEPESTKIS